MDLLPYVARLHRDLGAAAEAGTDEIRVAAERLAAVLESSTRLVLLDALVEAAGEISRELDPGSVDVRLRGQQVHLAVTAPPAAAAPAEPAGPVPSTDTDDDGGTARLSLRLPERLKREVEQAAEADGLSVNAWLVRSIGSVVAAPAAPASRPTPTTAHGQRRTGWVR
jgi:hypothetical protein